jgi:hypothetical protein
MAVLAIQDGLDVLDRRARLATWVVWAFVVVAAGATVGHVLEVVGTIDTDAAALDDLGTVFGLIYILEFLTLLLSVYFVSMWMHRAHANLRDAGLDGLEFTPGSSVGWFFAPIANLFKPFQAMRELFNASQGEAPPYSQHTPGAVSAWWAAWLVGNFASNIDLRMSDDATLMGVLGTGALAVAAQFLIDIIGEVTASQHNSMLLSETFA